MEYKVGDKVKIREDLSYEDTYGGFLFIPEMINYKGKVATILETNNVFGKLFYKIDIDNKRWKWTDEMIECKVEETESQKPLHNIKLNKGDKVIITDGKYKDIEGEMLDYVVSMGMYLIQTDDYNRLYIPVDQVKLTSKECIHTLYDEVCNIEREVKVKIDGYNITVTLPNGKDITCNIINNTPIEDQIESLFYCGMFNQYNFIGNKHFEKLIK